MSKHKRGMNRHHFVPKSRGGKETVLVDRRDHKDLHWWFTNKTPEEIIDYLNRTFWGSHYSIHLERVS